MKTIHPGGLANLIATRKPFDLLDLRTKEEFDKAHIPGAIWAPLSELHAYAILHTRRYALSEPVYIIGCYRALAGLAAGILEGAGCENAVVVDGGMETWETRGLSVIRTRWRPNFAVDVPVTALLAILAAILGFAVHELFFVVALVTAVAALSLTSGPDVRRQGLGPMVIRGYRQPTLCH